MKKLFLVLPLVFALGSGTANAGPLCGLAKLAAKGVAKGGVAVAKATAVTASVSAHYSGVNAAAQYVANVLCAL